MSKATNKIEDATLDSYTSPEGETLDSYALDDLNQAMSEQFMQEAAEYDLNPLDAMMGDVIGKLNKLVKLS